MASRNCEGNEHPPARLRPVRIPPLCIKMSDPMETQVVPSPRLSPVVPTELKIRGSDITLTPVQTIYCKNLMPCLEIVEQHSKIWYSRKPGATARKLRQANALLDGLLSSVKSMDAPEQLAIHLHAALRNKSYRDIIRCIYAFKGASEPELKEVKNHRYALQNHLLGFLEALKNYYEVFTIQKDTIQNVNWQEFVAETIKKVEEVEIEDDLVDNSEAVPPNPLVS